MGDDNDLISFLRIDACCFEKFWTPLQTDGFIKLNTRQRSSLRKNLRENENVAGVLARTISMESRGFIKCAFRLIYCKVSKAPYGGGKYMFV